MPKWLCWSSETSLRSFSQHLSFNGLRKGTPQQRPNWVIIAWAWVSHAREQGCAEKRNPGGAEGSSLTQGVGLERSFEVCGACQSCTRTSAVRTHNATSPHDRIPQPDNRQAPRQLPLESRLVEQASPRFEVPHSWPGPLALLIVRADEFDVERLGGLGEDVWIVRRVPDVKVVSVLCQNPDLARLLRIGRDLGGGRKRPMSTRANHRPGIGRQRERRGRTILSLQVSSIGARSKWVRGTLEEGGR